MFQNDRMLTEVKKHSAKFLLYKWKCCCERLKIENDKKEEKQIVDNISDDTDNVFKHEWLLEQKEAKWQEMG